MSQYDFGTIDPQVETGTQLAEDLNRWRDAIHTSQWGPTRPTYAVPGILWVNDAATPECILYLFDGTTDIPILYFNVATHTGTVGNYVRQTLPTGSAAIPAGTEAQRDATPFQGYTRFNTESVGWEGWDGTAWVPIGSGTSSTGVRERFIAAAGATVFTLAATPQGSVDVTINGILQDYGDAYTVVGNVVTLSEGAELNDEVIIAYGSGSDILSAEFVEFVQEGADAIVRTSQSKMRESITAQDFGAVGNGVTDDTIAFALLETDHPGNRIDLLGRQYLVTALPTGCQYYNGDFIAGTTRVSLRRNPLDNPIDGNSWIAFGDGLTHYWLFGFVHIESSGKLLAFVKASYRHGTSDSSPLNMIASDDRGATWKEEQTIYAVAGFDISHAASAVMSAGRIGLVVYVKDIDTAAFRNDFVYSDDGGVTWAANIDVAAGLSAFTYGDVLPYPAIAGGNDATGFAAYGYAGTGVRVLTTVNNGATWSSADIAGLGATYNEVSVVRVPGKAQWIMFLRSDGANMSVATSTNMKVWTTPVDSGFALESNPVYAFVANGALFVYCALRDYSVPSGGKENQFLCFEEDPSAVYAASNLVNKAPRSIADGIERNVGYLCIRPVGQDFVWGYTSGEDSGSTNSGGAASIVFGSTRKVPGVGMGFAQSLSENPNLLRNSTFELWSRGTSFPGLTVTAKTADGWSYNPSGATATVARVELTAEQSNLFPFNPHYGYSFITSVPNDFAGLYQQFNGKEELFRFSEQHVTFQVWGIGDVPQGVQPLLPRFSISMNYGVGGSAMETTVAFVRFVESTGNIWKGTVTTIAPTTLGKTIGTSPFIRLQFDSQSPLGWSATICGIKAEFGQQPTRFAPVDYARDKLLCARYVHRLEVPGIDALCMIAGQTATAGFGVQPFPDMAAEPVISFVSGTAADFEVYPSGVAISAITWSNIGKRAATINVTTTGLVAAGSYEIRSKTGTTPAILFDAE